MISNAVNGDNGWLAIVLEAPSDEDEVGARSVAINRYSDRERTQNHANANCTTQRRRQYELHLFFEVRRL